MRSLFLHTGIVFNVDVQTVAVVKNNLLVKVNLRSIWGKITKYRECNSPYYIL